MPEWFQQMNSNWCICKNSVIQADQFKPFKQRKKILISAGNRNLKWAYRSKPIKEFLIEVSINGLNNRFTNAAQWRRIRLI